MSLVDPGTDDHSEGELEAGFEGAFEGFHHSGGHMDIGNDLFQGVEPMGTYHFGQRNLILTLYITWHCNHSNFTCILHVLALDESGNNCHGDKKVLQSYEDLVRNYVVSSITPQCVGSLVNQTLFLVTSMCVIFIGTHTI